MEIDEYKKLAEVEDTMWYFVALHQRMLIPLAHWRGHKAEVLDAGCGTGGLIRTLEQHEPLWSITGVDFSPMACSMAKERTHARIIQGSVTDLPFANESFDIVLSADVISEVEDPSQALSEFSRVLKPGGVIVINVSAYQWLWSYHDDAVNTKYRYRRSELVRMVRSCQLVNVQASYANMFILPLIVARRKIFPPKVPTSDVKPYSPMIDQLFSLLASAEHAWLRHKHSLPTGCSVFLAAYKANI